MNKLNKLPISFHQCIPVLIVVCLALLAYVFDRQLSNELIYQHSSIKTGEIWRLFTGHFFHTNGYHLLLNLAALCLLWSLHGQFYTYKNYAGLFIFSAFFTSLGLYFFSSYLENYVGLSGVLHGIFVWGSVQDIKNKDKTGYLLFIGVWLKILHEQIFGASDEVMGLIEANVAVDAHLWGAISGLLFSIFHLILAKNKVHE